MRRKLRLISILLCAFLLLSLLPVPVWAETTNMATAELQNVPVAKMQYYGRTALENMDNEALLYAYDQIVAGVENSDEKISVYNGSLAISVEELELVLDAYRRDYTHHFWIGNGWSISYNPRTATYVWPQYLMSGSTLATARAAFEAEANRILSRITDDMSEYEIELYLHDTLAEKIVYEESTNAHNAYGAMVEGVAVCEGYAEAFQYLLHRAGIFSYIVLGSSKGVGHAWNIVRIDGKYYHVDLTWNDQESDIYHAYFNVTDTMIRKDHIIDPTTYALPACNATDAFYFTGKDTYLDTYSVESVGKLMQDNDLRIHIYAPGDLSTVLSWYFDNAVAIAMAAGVNGGFGYGYTYLGNEAVIYITGMSAKVTDDAGVSYFNTLSAALNNSVDGSKLRLVSDVAGNFTTALALELDLNGCDITGDLTAARLVVWDSQTDDYTVNNGNGFGVITGTVTNATAAEGYVMLVDEGMSFHKVDVALDKIVLKAASAGLYYTGSFRYDEIVAAKVATAGIALSTQNQKPVADDSDPASLYTSFGNSVLVNNILSEDSTAVANRISARSLIYARAYLKLQDGTFLYSNGKTTNLQMVVETLDAKAWSSMNSTQQTAFSAMYKAYADVMSTWNIPNLKNQ